MTIVRLVEDEVASAAEWKDRLDLDRTSVRDLVRRGVLSPVRNDPASDPPLQLTYVGLIATRHRLGLARPRFAKEQDVGTEWLRRVLRVYFRRSSRRNVAGPLEEFGYRDEGAFRELDALTTLRSQFERRGLYARREVAVRPAGEGATDWGRTIRGTVPIVTPDTVFYPDPLGVRRLLVANEVSLIQVAVTSYLAGKYGEPVPDAIDAAAAGLPKDFLNRSATRFHLATLRREQARTYLADDLQLLDTLAAVLDGLHGMAGIDLPLLYGTRAFALVWEDALRDLLGHDDIRMGRLVWTDWLTDEWSSTVDAGEQRPDLVLTRADETLVVDAKYHHPFPARRPGWADVVKQLYYAESAIVATGHTVRNLFVLPTPLGSPRHDPVGLAGRVAVAGGARRFPSIEAWFADPEWVFLAYGQSDHGRCARARRALFAARDEAAEVLVDADSDISVEG